MKKARQLIIGLAIATVAFYYTLRNVSLDELVVSFKDMDLIYILPSIGFIILGYVGRAYRWQVLLRPFKQIPIKVIKRMGESKFGDGFLANQKILKSLLIGIIKFR